MRTLCDISLHIDARNYGVVEDRHQVLMHVIAQYPERQRERSGVRSDGTCLVEGQIWRC